MVSVSECSLLMWDINQKATIENREPFSDRVQDIKSTPTRPLGTKKVQRMGFMGRNCSQWLALLLYYIAFYTALFGSCYVMLMFVYLQPQEKPRMTMDTVQPIIYSPGLGMRPYLSHKKYTNEFSPLIEFTQGDKDSYSEYTTSIAAFLKSYGNASDFTIKDCHTDKTSSCPVKLSRLGPCSGLSDKSYGYDSGSPCVLLKINKIYGWKPEAHDKSPYSRLGHWSTNSIAVHCQKYEVRGDGSDAEKPAWSVQLHPPDGFPFSCFPFCDKKKYVAPLVMAQFKNLPPDESVQIWCRAFAKNIQLERHDRAGSVRFTLRLNS